MSRGRRRKGCGAIPAARWIDASHLCAEALLIEAGFSQFRQLAVPHDDSFRIHSGLFQPVDPNAIQRQDNHDEAAFSDIYFRDFTGRITAALGSKQKVTGFAEYHGEPVLLVGHVKGRDTKEKIYRNFGYARPEGYRKALKAMQMAQKFGRAIVCFVDTPAAYPGIESEERGVAEAIALNLREMAMLEVPIIVIVHGEGGSGGALGIAIGDRILMHEFAIYSVIPPEGCAAILWRDSNRKVDAAQALKLTSPDLLRFGIIDQIVREPSGGAHTNHDLAARLLDEPLSRALSEVSAMNPADRLEARYRKFRVMGNIGIKEA